MRIAIVGAGPAGLAALRALTARGFDAVAFERRPDRRRLGARRSPHGRVPLAPPDHEPRRGRSTRSSRCRPGRPTTRAATRSAATSRTTPRGSGCSNGFGSATGSCTRAARTTVWEIELENGDRALRHLVVANGHNEEPKWPDPPYPAIRRPPAACARLRGGRRVGRQRVMVVGMGNSAMDIVTDLSLRRRPRDPLGPQREAG